MSDEVPKEEPKKTKFVVIKRRKEIETLKESEEFVHLAFRPSNKDIFKLVIRCPNVKVVHLPSSYKKTISGTAKMYLSMQNIELMKGDVWGHRSDIDKYAEIELDDLDETGAESV